MLPVEIIDSRINNISVVYSGPSEIVDPMKFCHSLIKSASSKGIKVYENSPIKDCCVKGGINKVNFNYGSIECKKIIYTTSINSMDLFNKFSLDTLNSVSIVTNSFSSTKTIKKLVFIFEASNYKVLIRTTEDNRILASIISKEASWKNNLHILLNTISTIFPECDEMQVEYQWRNSTLTTKSKLPILGESKDFQGFYYNLPYGTNRIIYSCIGASILKDLILYNNNPDVNMFNYYI